jgi:hypothetical protein
MRQSSRNLDALEVIFDDKNAIANGGLVLPMTLADRLGLKELVDRNLHLGDTPGHANVGQKARALVASALVGGDSIDDAVRHAALLNRVGMKRPTCGLSQQAAEAGGSLTLGTQGRVGAAPTTTGRAGTARRPGPGKQGRKVYERNQRQSSLRDSSAPTWWIWADQQCTPALAGDSGAGKRLRQGGHEESLRRTRGEAAGAQLGTSPADRLGGERGNHPVPPSPPACQAGGGQARCRLLAPRWDGALVVVRAGESPAHGEGGQQVRKLGTGTPGDHR